MNLLDPLEKITKKTLVYASFAYGMGLLLINCDYAFFWGFSDFNIFNAQCVIAAIEVCLIAAFAFVPVVISRIFTDLMRRLSNRWKFFSIIRDFCVVVLAVVVVAEVAIVLAQLFCPSLLRTFRVLHAAQAARYVFLFYPAFLYLMAVIASVPVFGLWGEIQKRKVPWYEVVMSALIGLLLIPYCLAFYIAIPVRWGGGRPERKDLWVSSIALPMLAPCSREAKHAMELAQKRGSGHDNDLFLIEGLYLLHERSNSLILWSNECSVILEMSEDLVKGDQWPKRGVEVRP